MRLLKYIVLSGGTAQHLLSVLAESSHEDTARIFAGVIHLWLECIELQTKNDAVARAARQSEPSVVCQEKDRKLPDDESIVNKILYGEAKRGIYERILDVDNALYNIIQFTTEAAKQNATTRLGMIDAGCLVLVLTAFASPDFEMAGLVNTPGKQDKAKGAKAGRREGKDPTASSASRLSAAAMNARASTLLVVMRYTTFREFWGEHRFNTRLSLCSSLVDSLLGKDGEQGGSRETRALFKEIVGR